MIPRPDVYGELRPDPKFNVYTVVGGNWRCMHFNIAKEPVARVIILESFLSFLGLGIQPPTPAWGNMLGEGRVYMLNPWWIAAFPGLPSSSRRSPST